MVFIGGCAGNTESTFLEGEPNTESGSSEILAKSEKHYWVSWQGEVFDSVSAPGGVDESLDTLVWLAFREGIVISEEQSAEEDVYITESNQVLEGSEEVVDNVWIRIVQEEFVPDESAIGHIAHKDYIIYTQEQDAYVGVQSVENNELWTILKMDDYGDWLEKEIKIYIRMTTGL